MVTSLIPGPDAHGLKFVREAEAMVGSIDVVKVVALALGDMSGLALRLGGSLRVVLDGDLEGGRRMWSAQPGTGL